MQIKQAIAVGGATYLISKAIHSARVLAFADLGMEAIYEFDVVDMPVTVAVDSLGSSVPPPAPPSGSPASPSTSPTPRYCNESGLVRNATVTHKTFLCIHLA
jgi:hypothetical protein